MKKALRKLQLHRETVRPLDSPDLAQAWGGSDSVPPPRDTLVRPSDACPPKV
jgi:hypothetical protein